MLALTLRTAGIAVPLALAACTGPPWTVEHTPDAITLRWYVDETDSATADATAQAHCQSSGRNAELISYDQNGSAQIGKYRCR